LKIEEISAEDDISKSPSKTDILSSKSKLKLSDENKF
jgi:hypothetical protein